MNTQIIVAGVLSQLYTRLITAAIMKAHVYYSDLAPVVFGVQLTKVGKSQYQALWDVVAMTMQMDHLHGRPPVAALYVSRANASKRPPAAFFTEYERLTGKRLDDDDWQDLVDEVWAAYSPPTICQEPT